MYITRPPDSRVTLLMRVRRIDTRQSICMALALHFEAEEWAMIRGSITSKDVLLNTSTIVRSFGLGTYVRCIRALLTGRPTTFLELAWRYASQPHAVQQ